MSSSWTGIRERFGSYFGMLIICVGGVLLLVMGGILPTGKQIERMRAEVVEMRTALERREALMPIRDMLAELVERPAPEGVSLPERAKLSLAELPDVPALLGALAGEARLEMLSASPQLRSMQGESGSVRVDTHVRGEYENMQLFLLKLAEFSYLDRVEGISVYTSELGRELRLTLWLGIQ